MQYLLGSLIAILALAAEPATVRIKDATRIGGNESHTLVGYGLVVGLAGSGDSDQDLTRQTIAAALENFRVKVAESELKALNCAVVLVTVTMPNGGHQGDMLNGTVATVGDAKSLVGGELLLTALLGTDGEPWAIGQGALTVGGYAFGGSGAGSDSQSKSHPTTAKLTSGIKLLRDVGVTELAAPTIMLYLKQPDFTTAVSMSEAINLRFAWAARVLNRSTLRVNVPASYLQAGTVPVFVSELEQVRFVPDSRARIVFSERTGTIVIGREVRLSSVAISHGSITVSIKSTVAVSQPEPFRSGGTTVVAQDEQTTVTQPPSKLNLLPEISNIGDLVDVLNTLGVTPQDIMAIFIALQHSGALHAEIEVL